MIENTVKLGMKINYRMTNSPTLTEDVYETLMYRKEIANDIIKENSGHNQGIDKGGQAEEGEKEKFFHS